MITALTGAAGFLLAGTALTGTAHAYPVKDEALTKSKLYSTGKLAETECAEPSVKAGSVPSARKYWTKIHSCLNDSWKTHLTKAGLPFSEPVLKFGRIPKGFCGYEIGKENSQAYYCAESKTVHVQLGKDWVEEADDLFLLHAAAELYGFHVMNLVGIDKAFEAAPYSGKNEMNEQIRRNSLQGDCLSGVFLRSVWSSLDRSSRDWRELQGILKSSGDAKGAERVYGKGSNRLHWTKRGYATGDPASCNTWTASPAKVA
ncbi:hypothetical protein GCM10010466_40910 [Planomonospora alba]|uniref:Metalloprotease n=2 Tax=Planomonospora alba TaxID=161354 RepID=A0ABP6NEF4_9ACTN